MNEPSPAPTLDALATRGILDADSATKARELLRPNEDSEKQGPWFVRFLQVVGAWLSALFFIGFLGTADLLDDEATNLVLGIVFIVGATGLSRLSRNLFAEQALTALSIAGHLIFVFTLWEEQNPWIAAIAAAILLPLTYPFFRVGVHRVFSCHFAALILFFATLDEHAPDWNHLTVALAAAGVVLLHSGRFAAPFWRPAAYSAVTVLLGILILMNRFGDVAHLVYGKDGTYHGWIAALIVTLVLPLLPLYLQRHRLGRARVPTVAGATVLGALAFLTEPALAAALWIFVIGHLRGDRILSWLGAIATAISLTFYYYNLDLSLLIKSVSLVALGLVFLLLGRLVASRRKASIPSRAASASASA